MTTEPQRVSRKQEKAAARTLGARQHRGSGSGAKKFDMHTDDTLIECKTVLRGKKQITIKTDVVDPLSYHAAIQGRAPILHIELDGKRWILLPEDDYVSMKES